MRIVLNNVNIKKVYDSGQCFTIIKDDEEYWCVGTDKACLVKPLDGNNSMLFCKSKEYFYWLNFFNTSIDYESIRNSYLEQYSLDTTKKVLDMSEGLVLLNQEYLPCLLSFITSQRKSVPSIRSAIKGFIQTFGTSHNVYDFVDIEDTGKVNREYIWTFPTLQQLQERLTVEQLENLGFGYRTPYIYNAVFNYLSEKRLTGISRDKAIGRLKTLMGVGDKIANCVALYSLGYRDAYPRDIWILRFEEMYCNGHFDESKFAHDVGIIQLWQYYFMLQTFK